MQGLRLFENEARMTLSETTGASALSEIKTMPSELTLPNQAADWTESPSGDSGVDTITEDAA